MNSATYKNGKPENPGKGSEIATLRDPKFGMNWHDLAIPMGTRLSMVTHTMGQYGDNRLTEKLKKLK